ncbi:hypothetical protein QR685DRAFT_547812 [Neurospora intermedia]|uniref:Kelch repeat protein n=1 Tax=Neurospora intermedia TaxID=5142 RepID=A0ABR3D0I7_NEUIN
MMFPSMLLPLRQTLTILSFIASLQWPLHVKGQNADTPSDSNFIRRGYERAAVIGSHLYLSGGEISQYGTGENALPPDDHPATGISSVLSIDLSSSWDTRNAPFQSHTFPDGDRPPVFNNHALWPWRSSDGKDQGFYIYGGQVSWKETVKDVRKDRGIWKFTVDGQGGGAWTVEQASNPEVFMAYAAGGERGWSIGGIMTPGTDPDANITSGPGLRIPGMVEYDFSTETWTNYTEVGFLPKGRALENGRAHFVDGLGEDGKNGVVMMFGGGIFILDATRTGDSRGITRPDLLLDFNNMTFFDAQTKKWHSQTTTGTPPTSRMGHCVAGVRSQAGTHEIFVYGGADAGFTESYDDLYVLSLPGFVWFRVDDRSNGVHSHGTCAVVGNRQLLVIGGQNEKDGWPAIWQSKDPLPLGLGIFDMTTMAWKSNGSYDAETAEYRPAEVIEKWYNDGGLDKVQWNSDDVKKMFLATPVNFTKLDEPSSSDKPSSGGGGSGSSDGNTDKSKDESNKSKTGPIVGGIVGGCVVVLGVIGGWLFWRRRHKKKNSAGALSTAELPVQEPSPPPPPQGFYEPYGQLKELPVHSAATEVYTPPTELSSHAYRFELDPDARPNELHGDAGPRAHELPWEGRPQDLSACR